MPASAMLSSTLDERLARLLAGDPAETADPYPLYEKLREQGPVYWHEGRLPFITMHETAKRVFLDSKTFHTSRGPDRFQYETRSPEEQGWVDEIVAFESLQMNEMNGDAHRRVRAAAQRAFPRQRIAEVGEYVEEAMNRLLDQQLADGEMEFMNVAKRLPVLAIVELIGAPPEDVDRLKAWGDEIAAVKPYYGARFSAETILRARDAVLAMKGYVAEMVDAQRTSAEKTPMITALLDAEEEDSLTEDELAGTISLFIYAAHETTTNMLGMGLYELMSRRDQWRKLKADPGLIPGAVEEILRYTSPVQLMTRVAVADAELAGETIKAGTRVMIIYASANRDPVVFEEPNEFLVERDAGGQLALGHGVHVCLGNSLARMEGRTAFEILVSRFGDMELTVDPGLLEWNAHPVFRGVSSVPIRVRDDRGRGSSSA